jgi:hypothetical protein
MTHTHHRSRLVPALALALAAALPACAGSVRPVKQGPEQGELSLVGNQKDARAAAKTYMEQHCPTGYQVLKDSKTFAGQRRPNIGTSEGKLGVAGTSPDDMQWRISYKCVDDAMVPPPYTNDEPAEPEAPAR